MVTLDEIRGQERAVAHLHRAIEADRVAHAYLFVGPIGCGKHATGLALAAALNCVSHPGRGCSASEPPCEQCHKIAIGSHPDVQTLEREGAAQIIPIATIRKQVIPLLASRPHEGRARVFLIEEATSLADASANALLKTLEEPPQHTHFVLGTSAPDKMLPTIRSRCQRVNFAGLPAELRAELDAHAEAGDATAAAATVGRLGAALEQAAAGTDTAAMFAVAAEAGADRSLTAAVLEALAQRYHRTARSAALDNDLPRAAALSRRAARVLEAQTAVTLHNAHGQLAIERLLSRLRALPAA